MHKLALCALAFVSLIRPLSAAAQQPAAPEMVFIRFAGWEQPVRLERREPSRIISTVFVKHGFGGWIPLENGPEFAAFRGDSIGLALPDPNADRISIDLPDREAAEDVVRTQLASMRPVLGGGFELDVDLS